MKNYERRRKFYMTVIHILNFTIPIICMIGMGILLDHLCKPDKKEAENTKE